MNTTPIVYEYHEETLGVQAKYLYYGRGAAEESLCLIGDRGFRSKIESKAIFRIRPNAPGQPMLVRFDSLPPRWQSLLVQAFGNPPQQVRQSLFERLWRRDFEAFDFYTGYQFADGGYLKRDKVEEYTTNASVLNMVITMHKNRRDYIRSLSHSPGDVDVWGVLCKEVERFRDVQPHTLPLVSLRRVVNAYKKDGYAAIISKKFRNSNARVVTSEVEELLNSLFADYTTKPTKVEIAEQYDAFLTGYIEVINNDTGEVYNPKDFPKLSESSITAYLSKWRNEIATYGIRSGDRQKYMGRFKPYHSLEQPKFAGSIISIDDRQPPFEFAKNKRMWWYNGIDLGSEAFTCWVWGKSKEGIILDFYRQMVRNYAEWGFNIPAELEAESSLNSSFTSTFLQEGAMFQYVRIEANNARGKRIEAYYKPLRYKHEKKHNGWLARPHALSEANQAGPKSKELVPYDLLVQQCLGDIQDWNNTEHSKIKGKTRWEVFVASQNPNTRPTNYKAIIPMLGYKTATSVNKGIVRLQEKEFLLGNDGIIAVGDSLVQLMNRVEKHDVDAYWLDANDGSVLKAYLFIGDELICEAIAKPTYQKARIEQIPADLANRELMSKYVATIEGYGRGKMKAIDRVTLIDNRSSVKSNMFQIKGLSRQQIAERAEEVEVVGVIGNDDFYESEERVFAPKSLKNRF